MYLGTWLKLGGSATALLMSLSPAHAQDGSAGTAGALPGEDQGVAAANGGGQAGQSDDSGEIVITAQRREERLRDVPLTVLAISGDDLAASGVTGTRDIQSLAPGVTITSTGQYTQATIRGVGSALTNGESPVSVYVDGVYFASQIFSVFDLLNVESVQVLKGPQGTLFGRNATGGAILVTTRAPSNHFTGRITGSFGRFDDVRLAGYVSGPLTDTLSADLVASYHDDNGYTRDALTGTRLSAYREYNVRGKLQWSPTDATRFRLIGDWGVLEDSTGNVGRPIPGTLTSIAGAVIPDDPYEVALSFEPYSRNRGGGVSLEASHEFTGVTLRSITAYRMTHHEGFSDQDRTQLPVSRVNVELDQNVFTQEVTLTSTNPGPFQWIAGAYYFREDRRNPTLSNGNLVTDATVDTTSYAGFGELTFNVTDRLKLIGGVRYSTETGDIFQVRGSGTPLTFDGRVKFDAWTPRASIVYALDSSSNIYATYSQGFKSGLINATTFAGAAIRPERLRAYEIGYKRSGRGLTFNLSGYYYDYQDLQLSARTPAGLSFILNAANATIYGIDADLGVRLTPELRLRAGANWTHSEYKNFTSAPFFVPIPTGGNTAVTGDASGNPLIRAPEFTGNLSLDYRRPIGSGLLFASGNFYYNSGFAWTVDDRVRQSDYVLVNAEIGWAWNDERYRVALWGRNLTDTLYGQSVSVTGFADAIAYARPRTYGVSFEVRF